jgi:hypothetical protein
MVTTVATWLPRITVTPGAYSALRIEVAVPSEASWAAVHEVEFFGECPVPADAGTALDASAPDASASGCGAPTPGSTACPENLVTCSAPTNVCVACLGQLNPLKCQGTDDVASCPSGTAFGPFIRSCDDAADCAPGQVCCGDSSGWASSCAASCTDSEVQRCATCGECGPGKSCESGACR